MNGFLRPERFDADPNSPEAAKQWLHWKRTFNSFMTAIQSHTPDKLDVLCNYVSPSVYTYIADYKTYAEAITALHQA